MEEEENLWSLSIFELKEESIIEKKNLKIERIYIFYEPLTASMGSEEKEKCKPVFSIILPVCHTLFTSNTFFMVIKSLAARLLWGGCLERSFSHDF